MNKILIITLLALGLVTGGYYLTVKNPEPDAQEGAGQSVFPGLEQQLNNITRIRIESGGETYDVTRTGDQWQLLDKGGYPVLFERVKPFLLAISRLEKIEPKTGKPENYARLGVQEPATGTGNTRIELYVAGNKRVASLIVGTIRSGLIIGDRDGIYVRVSGDSRAWLVAGNLKLPEKQVDWVDRQIIHIKPKMVKRLTILQPDNSRLVIEKSYRGAPGFSLVNRPEGVRPKRPSEINVLARSLAGLTIEDMRNRPPTDLSGTKVVTAVFETWDGLQVRVTTKEQNGQIWAWFDLAGEIATMADDRQKKLKNWIYLLPSSRTAWLRAKLIDLKSASPL